MITEDNFDIQEKIKEYLPVKTKEKNKFGEVFTPPELIDEMLDTLPSSVWKNPHLKWLDPANGIGNFPMKVFERLDKCLSTVNGYENMKKRRNHILKNMLYMVEINPTNVSVSRKILGEDANIYCGSFLEDAWKIAFGIDKFDVIMGNPPYNNSFNTGDNKPYIYFTNIGIHILNENGFIIFITPPSIYDYLLNYKTNYHTSKIYDIQKIHLNSKYLKEKYFKNIGSQFTYFLIKKTNYSYKTHIQYGKESYRDNINLLELPPYPKIWFRFTTDKTFLSIFTKLFSTTKTYTFKKALFNKTSRRIRKEHIEKGIVSCSKTTKYKFKIISSYNTKNDIFNPKIYYYDKYDNDFDKKRILMMTSPSYLYPYIIPSNSYTLSDSIVYINCSSNFNCENFLLFLKSDIGKYIDNITRPSKNNNYLLDLLSKLRPIPIKQNLTLDELYKYFKLTKKEIQYLTSHTASSA